ncbi:calcineurin-binding protein cabin-1-like isoform X3 [Lucilia cuprina]|uniref:calcineurin-binding protein cabin-1-like isoform X3 n=1 Tax=Lucilia cuprina TaxID=7375 RepID=UPI001F06CDD6|nr:calcineurin-binding protein cabin-1-like isoform X3 [Lucilia cuprina]
MIKIVALNDEGEDESTEEEEHVVTREAQETIAENEYIRAIKLKSEGHIDLCLNLLKELLQTQVLNENIKSNRSDKLWTIKYNCHKNIALILEERSQYTFALQHYIYAILIDSTDVSTLHKFGQLALKLNATDLAEYAFENCLGRNSAHWSAAEGMLQVMNINHNIMGSYRWARKIFQQDINCDNAEETLKEITVLFKEHLTFLKKCGGDLITPLFNNNQLQSTIKFAKLFNANQSLETNQKNISYQIPDLRQFSIKKSNWQNVGQFIINVHSYLKEIEYEVPFVFNFNDVIIKGNVNLTDIKKDMSDTAISHGDKIKQVDGEQINITCDENLTDQSKISIAEKTDTQSVDFNNYDSDSNAKSDICENNKAKSRRRCSDLHFLEQWGWHKNRRYSSRKKTERDEVDLSLNGYLRKILINYTNTPIEDKWPFSNISENGNQFDCNECKTYLSEDSFHLATIEEFKNFTIKVKERSIDVIELTFKWLKYISFASFLPMPDDLKMLYIDIFEIYMLHFSLTTWHQLKPKNYEASYRMCILYLELRMENLLIGNSVYFYNFSDIWHVVFHHLLCNIGSCHIIATKNIDTYRLKLIYLEYLMFNRDHCNKECLSCLQQMCDILERKDHSYILHLPNLGKSCLNINYVKNLQLKYKRQMDVSNIPKLYEEGSWDKLANIIKVNIESSGNQYSNEGWLKDFCVQIEILLQSLWIMESYEDCLIWAEKCFHFAISNYLQESKSSYRCSLLAQLINYITSYMEAIILNEGFHIVAVLSKANLSRMVQDVIRILVYQFDGTFDKNSNHGHEINFKRTWVILHRLILREENDSPNTLNAKTDDIQDVNELIPKSFLILFTAHEYLGKRQWCTNDNGEFLQYILDAVVLNLKAPVYDVCRDVIYEYLEQVTYCLFKYPQKKARLRHLEDHEASQIKLCWPKAIQVFDLYRPEDLPEFNSYKLESISSDMEQLLLKIVSLMPKELDPSKSIHYVTMFIEGRCESPTLDANAFKLPYKVLSLYYLLADFYFKNRDFIKAIKFYTLDLAVNPTRFDSWAGMALSKASKIETKLNGLDPISMQNIWEECEEVLRCFECCINLNRFQTLLWIEYGSFSYTIHSCFSRYLKNNSKTDETYDVINERKNKMLTIAYNCFSFANSLQSSTTSGNSEDNSDANDEKWLCQYMLGKISEKRKEEPKIYLNYYLMAANHLYENSATYPIKINHSNPTTLSVEALEVFYRINAAIIKYLQSGKEITRSTGDLFNKILKNLSNSPFAYNKAKIDGNSLNMLKGKLVNKFKHPVNNSAKQEVHTISDTISNVDNIKSQEETKEISKCLKISLQEFSSAVLTSSGTSSVMSSDTSNVETESDSDESITDNESNSHIKSGTLNIEELKLVYRMVVQNIEECATRFPEHYKSIYRLVYHYMNSPMEYCDLAQSEQLLLGQYKTSLGNLVNGLFYDRKNNNLFNGIWRIPSSEIDRPGSFSAHLVKCVKIFIQLLYKTNNHGVLIDIAMNLYKTPDLDKRYITDAERKELCQQSINYSIKILRCILQRNAEKRDDSEILNLLLDVYKIHKKCVKYMNQKEPMFAELLIDVYKCFIKDKVEYVPDSCNFLDLAIKLCVQEITAQKNSEKSIYTDSTSSTSDYIVSLSSTTQSYSNSMKIRKVTFVERKSIFYVFSLRGSFPVFPTELKNHSN